MQKRGVSWVYFLVIGILVIIIIFLSIKIFSLINDSGKDIQSNSSGNLTSNISNTSNASTNTSLNSTLNKTAPIQNKSYNTSKPVEIHDPVEDEEPEEKTCREEGGEICMENEKCDEELFSASDTNQCCLGSCILKEIQKEYPEPSDVELAVHSKINENRAAAGVGSLEFDNGLADVARKHSQDMVARDFFDHVNPDNLDPFDRIAAAGISCLYAGENIAFRYVQYGCGDGSAGAVATCIVDGWMNSPGHKMNLLTAEYKKEGIGVAITSDGQAYATEVFCD